MTQTILDAIAAKDSPAHAGVGLFVTLQQKSTGRFLDAHLTSGQDYRVVTRPQQSNDTQRWQIAIVGHVRTIYQLSNGRYLSSRSGAGDMIVTATPPDPGLPPGIQDEVIPRWAVLDMPDGSYRIRNTRAPLYVDAHLVADEDYQVVGRPLQNNDSQLWLFGGTPPGPGVTIRQKSTGRFLDAYQDGTTHDFRVVTRPEQENATQRWVYSEKAYILTVRQVVNGRLLDAHQLDNNHSVVTRMDQNNDTQWWVLDPRDDGKGGKSYTLTQLSSGSSLYAQTSAESDYRAFTGAIVPFPWGSFVDGEWLLEFV